MKIGIDTNVLVRAVVGDDKKQAKYESHWLGGEKFVSFDQKAVNLLAKQKHKTLLLN